METTTAHTFDFEQAFATLQGVVKRTPLEFNAGLSLKYNANIYLKREDLQIVRSYKLRGAYNKISTLDPSALKNGIVCASAGNHAQGVAFSCKKLGIKGVIFMPEITPKQKIKQVNMFGGDNIEIILVGDTFDDCLKEALIYCEEKSSTFIPPFDDEKIIEGQATVAMEIFQDLPELDAIVVPVGGGGLASGVSAYLQTVKPEVKIFGVEPMGAPSLSEALKNGGPITVENIESRAHRLVDRLALREGRTVVVSNEVGMGIHPESEIGRQYRDCLGRVNSIVAAGSASSVFMSAGRAVILQDVQTLI